ncbi:MAG TPA: sugar phosphate isomerase/epimerase [Gemmatimonadaceae bacterium]|nr:sugar phosphate isomerase/epimerase [Gemmatimonadaceae bacterium]
MIDRRSFFWLAGAGLLTRRLSACTAAPSPSTSGSPARALERIGLQLYTVRSEMQKSVPQTLARVAAIGFREVEFAGYFNHSPAELRKLLDEHGLSAPSTHVSLGRTPDEWQRALADAAALGSTYATVPWLDAAVLRTVADWERMGARFNAAAAAAKSMGLRFAYHNHDFEMRSIEGRVPLEILLASTDPALVDFEMDIYWVVKGGGDPLSLIARYPGRFVLAHAKDATAAPEHRMVDVGAGTIDFARVLGAGMKAGMRFVFVEHDRPADPFASVTASYRTLSQLRLTP